MMKRLQQLGILGLVGLCLALLANLSGCDHQSPPTAGPSRLVVGLVSYDTGATSVEAYAPLQNYLGETLKTYVELEPVFNELRAVEQIQAQAWDLAFAPAGLAAIAIDDAQYVPLFPLQGSPQQRSVLVVPTGSAAEALSDLANEVIALGEPGSATGYYLPLYDLYGLTFSEIRFAPTPRIVLEWIAEGTVAAGAISEEEFQQYRSEFPANSFRVLHESRVINNGAVLLSPAIERNQQRLIEEAMKAAPASVASDAGYIANAAAPTFDSLIQLVDKVRPIAAQVREQPAILTIEADGDNSES